MAWKRPYKKRELFRDVAIVREETLFVAPNFRGRIQQAIEANGITRNALCNAMGIAPQTFQSFTHRQKTLPLHTLEELERRLHIPREFWTAGPVDAMRILLRIRRSAELAALKNDDESRRVS